jgi:beta propeller repeat protein
MNPAEGGNLYMYDLSAHKETPIVTSNSAGSPAVYGSKIVYFDRRNSSVSGVGDIYMYDVSRHKETQLTTHGSAEYPTPAIYGNNIAWVDGRNGNDDIYVNDLSKHQETHTTNGSTQTWPDIYGNRVVWMDNRNGNYDIYMGTLSYLPVAAFSGASTSGKAPLKVQFTDKSIGSPNSWKWSFGDGKYSTQRNPAHTYSKVGKYTVSLAVKNSAGSNTKTIPNYIIVKK